MKWKQDQYGRWITEHMQLPGPKMYLMVYEEKYGEHAGYWRSSMFASLSETLYDTKEEAQAATIKWAEAVLSLFMGLLRPKKIEITFIERE